MGSAKALYRYALGAAATRQRWLSAPAPLKLAFLFGLAHVVFVTVGPLGLVSTQLSTQGTLWETHIEDGEEALQQGNYAEAEPLFKRLLATREKVLKVVEARPTASTAPPITFVDETARSGVRFRTANSKTSEKYLMESMVGGVAMLDFDADGLLDLFLVNGAALADPMPEGARPDKSEPRYWNRLYRNDRDGTFRDVTEQAGVGGGGWSASAAFLDYDRDGHLDLFVTRYVVWDFQLSPFCGDRRPGYRGYCHPRHFKPISHLLYRNNGDDTFTETALLLGLAYDDDGKTFAGMGTDFGDYDNDGWPDIFVNALAAQRYALFRNDDDSFEYASGPTEVARITLLHSGWGTKFVDFDNDGWKDLMVGQGHVMDNIHLRQTFARYLEPLLLMRNLGGRFEDVSKQAGPAFQVPLAARGAAFGDLNNDGRLDIVVSVLNGIVKLRLTAVFDAQHGGFETGWSPISWGSIDELFVNLTMPHLPRRQRLGQWPRRRRRLLRQCLRDRRGLFDRLPHGQSLPVL